MNIHKWNNITKNFDSLVYMCFFICRPSPHVKHYHIKQNSRGEFYLSEKHCCTSIPDLINYHKHNSGGLASRLKTSPCDRPAPATAGLSHGKLLPFTGCFVESKAKIDTQVVQLMDKDLASEIRNDMKEFYTQNKKVYTRKRSRSC